MRAIASKLRSPLIAVAFCVGFVVAASATTQTAPPGTHSHMAPGQSAVSVAPAFTGVTSQHYQAELQLTCDGNFDCQGSFPIPGRGRQLNVTRVSCQITAQTTGTIFDQATADVFNASNQTLVSVPLSGILSTGYYRHSLNNDVDVLVGGLQHLHVELDLANGQTFSGFCTAMGTLYTVQ